MEPIGVLRADFKQKFCTPRQGSLAKSSRAVLELSPEWRGRGLLAELAGFSHVWVISHLHLNSTNKLLAKVHPPRLRGRKVGLMASRSPHHPNQIGLTLARVLRCEGDVLELSEIDLVDGTPVLDLKPYVASADRPDAYMCGWVDEEAVDLAKPCEFDVGVEARLGELAREGVIDDAARVRALIVEMLGQDPRSPAYLNRQEADFAVWVSGLNVKFRFVGDRFVVREIEVGGPGSDLA